MAFRARFQTRRGEPLFAAETFPLREAAALHAETVILAEPQRCHVLTESGKQVAAVHIDTDVPVEIVYA